MRWPRTRCMLMSVCTCICFSWRAASRSTGLSSRSQRTASYGTPSARKTPP